MDNTIEQQRAIYGTSLAERFGAVMKDYGLSQRSLAAVLGISAPMLSQLIGARRIKIGNPAVYGRLLMLEARVGEPDRQAVLSEVQAADAVTATHSETPRTGAGRAGALDYLRGSDPQLLRRLAQVAGQGGDQALAQLFTEAADRPGTTPPPAAARAGG